MTTEEIISRFPDAKQHGGRWQCTCPAHDDNRASLSISRGDKPGCTLVKCFAGCATEAIVNAVGLRLSDLMPEIEKPEKWQEVRGSFRSSARYDYVDETGTLLFQVERGSVVERNTKTGEERTNPKSFRQRQPDGDGWKYRLDCRRVLYRLPDVVRAIREEKCVFLAEGEKDADNLRKLGFCATTNAGGAAKWESSFSESLTGAKLIILPDNDNAGNNHAERVARETFGKAASIRVLPLPATMPNGRPLPIKGDISDWIANGGTAELLKALVKACPEWSKPESSTKEKPEDLLFALTDLGNAERILHRHGEDLHYNAAFGWLIWDGKRWQRDESGQVYRLAEETIRAIPQEGAILAQRAADLPQDDERREGLNKKAQLTLQWAIKSEFAPRIKAAVDLLEHQEGIYAAPDAFDADPFLLNVQNGIIDLKTGNLLPHDKTKLCVKICPVNYRPDAAAPVWEGCLQRWQPLEDVRAFLQRAAGYTLTGHTGEETAFLLYGLGRNGKSKFTGALEYILGDYAGRAPIEIFMESRKGGEGPTPDKANLVGKRLIIASEIMQSRRFNESFVKDVTGGDKITASHKHKDPFTFKPQLKLWLYGNHKPIVTGADDGIKSRLPLIPFTVTIPVEERDPDLDAKLRAEAEGILAWAVRGCLDWQKRRLSPPAAIVQASEAYHEEMDLLAQFFKVRCIFGESKQVYTPISAIRDELIDWAKSEGIDEKALPKPNDLGAKLKGMGCEDKVIKVNKKTVRAWSNVRIRTEEDSLPPENGDNTFLVTSVTPVTPKTVNAYMRNYMEENTDSVETGVTGVTDDDLEPFPDDFEDPFGDEPE